MTALEQKFNDWNETKESECLSHSELTNLVKQLQVDRDVWITNAKNWEKENKRLNTRLVSAENQIMMDTECINRITNHGMTLELELQNLKNSAPSPT